MTTKALTSVSNLYTRLLSLLPDKNVTYCFAYGSGVVKQTGSDPAANMIDLILAVDDPSTWHKENIKRNASHYSGLRFLGNNIVSRIQTDFGASVYFNTLIPIKEENCMIKYGVISHVDLITDLLDWSDLYLAGRLHKPVEVVKHTSDSNLNTALQVNLHSAVHTTLLLLPEHFTEFEFYRTIASLSYLGDFRVKFGEDKNKLNNIVSSQLLRFRELYAPVLKSMSDYVEFPPTVEVEKIVADGDKSCHQDISPAAKHFHLNQLPRIPQRNLVKSWNISTRYRLDTEDVLHAVAYDPDCPHFMFNILYEIVFTKSITQSLKGIFTAGLFKSLKYSLRKITKMFKSMK